MAKRPPAATSDRRPTEIVASCMPWRSAAAPRSASAANVPRREGPARRPEVVLVERASNLGPCLRRKNGLSFMVIGLLDTVRIAKLRIDGQIVLPHPSICADRALSFSSMKCIRPHSTRFFMDNNARAGAGCVQQHLRRIFL